MPCLNSSPDCIELLTEKAIAHSPELKTLDEQIAIIEQRLALSQDSIRYSKRRRWTNYLTTDPIRLLQNLFGGGDVQRDNLAITGLEIRKADLEAAKALLLRRREETRILLGDKVLNLVLEHQRAQRQEALTQTQLHNQQLRNRIAEIDYRYGDGSTSQILSLGQQEQQLEIQLLQHQLAQTEAQRKLLQLTGIKSVNSDQ